MQRTNKQPNTRKTKRTSIRFIFALILLFAIVSGSVIAGLYFLVPHSAEDDITEEPISPQSSLKVERPADKQDPEANTTDKTPVQNEGEDPNALEILTGSIIYANVVDNSLRIRVNIDQYTSGSCELNLYRVGSDTHYAETTRIVDSASTSTCEGFDVPVTKLPSGVWKIEVILNAEGKTGNITGEVSI